MEFNINQSIHNEDNNENQKLLLKEIDESIFSSSIHKKRFGLLELHITVEKIYSHYDFEKIFRDLYLKTRGIKSIEIDENYYKAFIIFNPKKISLKEILENIIDANEIDNFSERKSSNLLKTVEDKYINFLNNNPYLYNNYIFYPQMQFF